MPPERVGEWGIKIKNVWNTWRHFFNAPALWTKHITFINSYMYTILSIFPHATRGYTRAMMAMLHLTHDHSLNELQLLFFQNCAIRNRNVTSTSPPHCPYNARALHWSTAPSLQHTPPAHTVTPPSTGTPSFFLCFLLVIWPSVHATRRVHEAILCYITHWTHSFAVDVHWLSVNIISNCDLMFYWMKQRHVQSSPFCHFIEFYITCLYLSDGLQFVPIQQHL